MNRGPSVVLIEFRARAALPPQKPTAMEVTPPEIRNADFAFEVCAGSFEVAAGMAAGAGIASGGMVASGWPYSLMSYPFHRRRLVRSQSMQMIRAGSDISAAKAAA